ncbi:MAG TPA: glycoside hydrolase family 18 protein [Candidatus Dormibacteraeota bacterium]|nr:glycoside hydrolase family 18 protein [Candidatus Dormibacteraeota bacterium]
MSATPVLAATTSGPLQREVFGFALASSLSDPTVGYPTWDLSLVSTVAFFGLHVNDNGTFASDSGLTVWNSSQLTGLVGAAHAHGTKVVLTVVLQDFSPGTPHMCAGLANRATTVSQTVSQVAAKGVDGVNIDYEGLNGTCPNGQTARAMMTDFAHGMRAALPAGSDLSVDTYASSASDPIGFFDIAGLNQSVDSFFVMAYDLEYSNYSRAPTSCSQFCLGPTAPLAGYYYNDTNTAAQYSSAVGPSKVILGVPYYGRKACVGAATKNAYPTGAVTADSYLDASQEAGASMVKAGSYAVHRDANDPAGNERWDTWFNTSLNCTRELYWDDVQSLSRKYALVNSDNLRGVGIWTLNYGGGSPELWSALSTYFDCAVGVSTTDPATSSEFTVSLTAGRCNVAYYEFQQQDLTLNENGVPLRNATPANGTASEVVEGYPGHWYNLWARAHTAAGTVTPWAVLKMSVAANASYPHPYKGLYTIDAYGGVNAAASPPVTGTAYWPGWKIARAGHALPGPTPDSGAVLDGWGGLHAYGAAMTLTTSAYWPRWDVARDFAFLPDGSGGYVLDAFGGLHPFSVNGHAMPPAASIDSYWPNWYIAKRIVIFSDGTGGYVLDAFGGVHGFGIGGARPAGVQLTAYWPNWDIARDLALIPGTHAGYVLDGWGGLHAFAPGGQAMPPALSGSAYWPRWDIARSVVMLSSATTASPAGYVLDGYGGLHPFGGAPPSPGFAYWGQDVARDVTGF